MAGLCVPFKLVTSMLTPHAPVWHMTLDIQEKPAEAADPGGAGLKLELAEVRALLAEHDLGSS